ncbi:MAG TPA: hypothetical protein VGJ70_00575 [Solirubrobacteraceae bacterium]
MEQARFLATDPAPLVEASLACPVCLHAVDWQVAGFGAQPAVACRCRGCDAERVVALSGSQLLRLATLEDDDGVPLVAPGLQAVWQHALGWP